jgi:integrase
VAENSLAALAGENLLTGEFFGGRMKRGVIDIETEISRWKNHVSAPENGAPYYRIDVREVTPDDLEQHLLSICSPEGKGLSRQTAKKVRDLVADAFDRYVKKKILTSNPAIGIKFPKQATTKKDHNVLSPEEIARVEEVADAWLDAGNPEGLIPLIKIYLAVCLGELYAIHLVDLHLDSEVPYVHIRYGGRRRARDPETKRRTGASELVPTKGKQDRKVPLTEPAIAALTKWLHALPTYCPSNPHGLLVPRPGGTPADKNYAPRSWEIPHGNKNVRARAIEKLGPVGAYPMLRAAGIDRHMRLHDLRHSGATAMLNGYAHGERYSLTEVGTMLGHKDVRTTQIYADERG